MELNLTNEEIEAIKYYKEKAFNNINQMLVADSRSDIVLLSDDENEDIQINYDKVSVINYIETIRKVYKAIFKYYSKKGRKEAWTFNKNILVSEIEKIKNEPYIDKFILSSSKINKDLFTNNQVLLYLHGNENIPYIKLSDILEEESNDVLISLFTKSVNVSESAEAKIDDKTIHTYTVELEKQELQELTEDDKISLYNHIISNSDLINTTLMNTVRLEKENVSNYESIRELEKQIADVEAGTNSQYMDDNELKEKLDIFKNRSADIFNNIKSNNKLITDWKRNVTVYLMAECADIEKQVIQELKQENENMQKEVEEFQEYARVKKENLAEENFENILEEVKAECQDNLKMYNNLISDINKLINRQQNFAKIAGNLGASYSALNNAFEMKKRAEELENLLNTIKLKVDSIGEMYSNQGNSDKLLKISEVNNQIGILINYLNNPKTLVAKSRMNRFDEMIVVEENELKRGIAKTILDIRGEAELKKLKDDISIIEDKGFLRRFLGIFTGQNKLDEFMLDQIEVRQKAIKKTLAKKLRLDYNYSIHEFVAEIRMFIKDNEDDDLVLSDVSDLRQLETELSKNFVIIDSKVKDIMDEKENKNLPIEPRVTKKELIEIETYRFLNKYGYDMADRQEPEEIAYTDTTSREIAKISDYINTSKILD